MKEEHREPWEIIGIITSGYLGVFSIHCVLTVMEYGLLIANNREQFNLGDCFQMPSLV
tara:strand:- start:44 stop:217 length:174 start_codon:yes stop_codon:yes gene_type:complete